MIIIVLLAVGLNCNMYHAGLSNIVRQKVHDEFVQDTVPIIIATVAFGMGIDKPGMNFFCMEEYYLLVVLCSYLSLRL